MISYSVKILHCALYSAFKCKKHLWFRAVPRRTVHTTSHHANPWAVWTVLKLGFLYYNIILAYYAAVETNVIDWSFERVHVCSRMWAGSSFGKQGRWEGGQGGKLPRAPRQRRGPVIPQNEFFYRHLGWKQKLIIQILNFWHYRWHFVVFSLLTF